MGRHSASGAGRGARTALVALALVALALAAAYAALLEWPGQEAQPAARRAEPVGAIEDGGPHEGSGREPEALRVELADDSTERTAPAAAPLAAPPAEVAPEPETVLVTGAAVRISLDGAEHLGDDGAMDLWVHGSARADQQRVEVVGGSFSVEVPHGAVLHLSGLELAGQPLFPEQDERNVPADGYLLVRGHELAEVRLHVVSAGDGRELDGVELWPMANVLFSTGYEHPGTSPEGDPVLRGATSPVRVTTRAGGSHASRGYWVRARDHAWAGVTLDHSVPGERTVELVSAGALEVTLVGSAGWLRPEVRLWRPGASRWRGYAFAAREPDAGGRALFESLATGTYEVSVERGWAGDSHSFGSAPADVRAGELARVSIDVTLPEAPRAVTVSGRLVLPGAWAADDVKLVFSAQGDARLWSEGKVEVPLGSMQDAGSVAEGDAYEWSVELPTAGPYALAVDPMHQHRLLEVPVGGLAGVEIVVPAPADVEVRVVDARGGAEIPVERLHWRPPFVDDALGAPLFIAARDPERGCVVFRAPAGPVSIQPVDYSVVLVDEEEVHELLPGRNELTLTAHRQITVEVVLVDGGTPLPWSWDWELRAQEIDGEARDVARGIGVLWFRNPGTYELFADGGVPGYEPIDGTAFVVRELAPGEERLLVEVELRPLP